MDNNDFRKEVGKYFLDLSKLIFGGVVLASIIRIEDLERGLLLGVGLIITLLSAIFGFIILKNKN